MMKKPEPKLTEQELEYLKVLWRTASKEKIQEAFPNRNYRALSNRMSQLGIKCGIERGRKGDVSNLLTDTEEAYYWLGFIAADGSINSQNQLVVMISERDKVHLEELAKFLKTEVKYPYGKECNRTGYASKFPLVRITVCDSKLMPKIKDKLGMTHYNKTYNPIDFDVIPAKFKLAFIIGFIDGDGSIFSFTSKYKTKKQLITVQKNSISIENHVSWKGFLQKLIDYVYKDIDAYKGRVPTSRITSNQGKAYAKISIGNKEVHKKLYTKAKTLPSLNRKWSKLI